MTKRRFIQTTLACTLALASGWAAAQQGPGGYPSRPVTLVVPFPAGGASDIFARSIGQKLSERLGQPFVVDNKPGATGLIGTTHVQRAKADGYTLLFSSNSSHVIAPLLKTKPAFDSLADFEPVTMLGRYPFALDVNPKLPVKTVKELVELARQSPGKLNFGSIGEGSGTHLAAELFRQRTGIDITHIPYKGTSALGNALIAGEIQIQFDSVGAAKPLIDAGRVRALAVTGSQRSQLLPNVPSLAEEGIAGVDPTIWIGTFAPKGTPAEIVTFLNTEIRKLLKENADVRRIFNDNGADIIGNTPQEFAADIAREKAQYTRLVNELKLVKD
ncbi:MAG: tripartite tricarboxylate transporter substrate binding protein [Proteobacteria bacterium]|jgi:tripartite-type tricarboxylate transporter receptor subunit TctC|nr:tripartite tricarboxylate transporter substrate binding protein [Pseudomonadota bacterium]